MASGKVEPAGCEWHCPDQGRDPNAKATVLQGDLSHALVPQSLWQMVRGWSLVTKNEEHLHSLHLLFLLPLGGPNLLTVPVSSLNEANIRLLSDGGDSTWTAHAATPGSRTLGHTFC